MPRPALTRDDVLAAALPVFARFGYRRTSMQILAEAVGRSRPALYQHFQDKEDVFRAVVAGLAGDLIERAREASRVDAPLAERLFAALVVKLDVAGGEAAPTAVRELYAEAERQAGDLVGALGEALRDLVAQTLAAESPLGNGREPDVAAVLVDAVAGIALSDAPHAVKRRRLRHLVELTVAGLTGHGDEGGHGYVADRAA